MKRFLQAVLVAAIVSVGVAVVTSGSQVAIAQADLGSVSGTVTDATGAVVSNATVTLTNNATGAIRTTVTNSHGEYAMTQLVPGTYTVNIAAAGFATAKESVKVTVGSSNTVAAKLAVAGGNTEVMVSADDFAGVQLDKPEISSVIQTEQLQNLPTVDRDPYGLVAFSGNLSSDPLGGNRGVGYNISGSRSAAVDILLDGAENTDLFAVGVGQSVPLDATSEIRVVTSNSGAEYGRGFGAVNVASKSGSNQFHGSVYEYNRISTFASDGYNNNYLYSFYGVDPKPRYTHNQFGYSIGGPVKRDKLFFFSSTEWTRIRSQQNVIGVVPTNNLLGLSASGTQDFFSTYGSLEHPINGDTYTGADIQNLGLWKTDINKIALQEAGLPSNTTLTGNCADPQISSQPICTETLFGQSIYTVPANSGGGDPVNQWITFNRADWTINQSTSLFARYIQQSSVFPAGGVNYSPYSGYNTGQTQYNHSLLLSLSKAFTPRLASATKVLGMRLNNAQPLAQAPVSPTLYVNGSSAVSLGGNPINFPGYSQLSPGNAIPFGGPQNFLQFGEDISWTHGKHQFSFGGTFQYTKDNRVFGAYENAVDGLVSSGTTNALYNFVNGGLGLLQVAVNPQGVYPCYRNVATGSYIETPECDITLPVSSPNFSRSNRYRDGAAYFADSWKLASNFTLNLGLRWELYGPQHSQQAAYDANFFMGSGTTEWDQIRNGQILTRENAPNGRLWNLNSKQFAPKVGFAWDPVGNGKTSIRGGFGLAYERNFNNVTFNVIQNPPNYGVVSFTTADNGGALIPISTNNFSTFGSGTGTKLLPNVTLRAVDPKIKPAYSENWSLSVEHQLASTTASLSYVGTRGIHNYSIANINRAYSGSNYLGDSHISNRTNLQYSNINWRGSDGDSYYNGLTAEIRSENLMHTGLTVRGDYTYSHSIDNTSSTFTDGASNNDNLGYLDPFNKALDRGNSDFDQRHRIAVAMFWEVPFGKHATGAARLLSSGWNIGTTFTAVTGNPFSVFDCYYAFTVCPRASFVNTQPKSRTGNMVNISDDFGANTYSYLTLPDYYDSNGDILLSNYNEQVNPNTGTSDTPICTGIYNAGCSWVPGMTGRNAFTGPGNWNQDLAVSKTFKMHERFELQLKGEFINLYNHANTFLNLNGTNDVSYVTDILAYKNGNRNTQLSLHLAF